MRWITRILLGYSLACLVAGPASAATETAILPINLTQPPMCAIYASAAINLGNYDASTGAETTGHLGYVCNESLPFTLSFDAGSHYASGRRNMVNPNLSNPEAYPIGYGLFLDQSHTMELGDAGYGDTFPASPLSGSGSGGIYWLNLYGMAFPGYRVPPGEYSDTVIMTFTY